MNPEKHIRLFEAKINENQEGQSETNSPNNKEPLKRKNLITNVDLEVDSEIVKFRSNPDFNKYSCLIFPDDKLKTCWDLFVVTLILYTVTVYIYRVAFWEYDTYEWVVFEYLVDFFFFIDLILTFFTSYYDRISELIVSHRKIFIHYATSWFIFDLLGCVPFEAFTTPEVGNSSMFSTNFLPAYRALRLIKLIRITKLWNNPIKTQELKDFLQSLNMNLTRMRLLCMMFILFCHVMCCFWCMLPRSYIGPVNWEVAYGIIDNTNFEKYLSGYYWLITTVCTIGFGDILPKNELEISVAIIVMSAGVFFYSYTISSITSMMASSNFENSRITEYTNVLQGIASEFKLSKSFHRRLTEALIYNLKEKRSDFSTLLNSLNPKAAASLKYAMNHKLLENNEFFKDKSFHFVQRILEFLMPYKVEANEYIYKEGSPCDEIYFVLSGEVVFVYDNDIIYESVGAGGYFGDAEIFFFDERVTTVKAIKRTKMLTLDTEILLNILKDYEKLKVDMIIMSMIKRKQLKKTSILANSDENSQDVHISPLQFSSPGYSEETSKNISVNFIEDCSSSLDKNLT